MTNNSFHFPVVLNELCSHIAHYDLLSLVVKTSSQPTTYFTTLMREIPLHKCKYTPSVTQSNLNYL